ncbi:MAG: DMT family transporter [Deltaproteobacteria bacterium]|nr:DMT family transporter [Deltaproteobacteria bacterium]
MPGFLTTGEFYSLACALIWAGAVIMFRKGGEQVPPVALNFFKDAVALALFLVTLPLIGRSFAPAECGWREWVTLLVSGVLGIGIADTLFFASLNRLGAVGSAVVDSLYSPFVVLCACLYLGEPLRLPVVLGAGLMVGAIIIGTAHTAAPPAAPPAAASPAAHPARREAVLGVILGLAAMALMAIGIVIAKPVLHRVDPWWAATVRVIGGTALLGVQALFPRNRGAVIACFRPSRVWRLTIPAAVLGAYIAMVIWVMGFKHTAAGIAGVLNQTSSIFVLILAALFLRERVTPRKMVAIVMAFAGAVVVVL